MAPRYAFKPEGSEELIIHIAQMESLNGEWAVSRRSTQLPLLRANEPRRNRRIPEWGSLGSGAETRRQSHGVGVPECRRYGRLDRRLASAYGPFAENGEKKLLFSAMSHRHPKSCRLSVSDLPTLTFASTPNGAF